MGPIVGAPVLSPTQHLTIQNEYVRGPVYRIPPRYYHRDGRAGLHKYTDSPIAGNARSCRVEVRRITVRLTADAATKT
jgi:hypothetical protein